jgi:RHS repeat-associated protein
MDKNSYKYYYDYENRIVKITKDAGDIAEFAYDALGRRIKKYDNIAMETTLYYYGSGWQVLAEYDTSDNLQRRFVYGNYIDEALVMNDGANDYYYAQDHLYSTAALLDNTGAVVERYEYDAYGQPYIMDLGYGARSTSLYDNPYMFTGRRVDFLDDGGSLTLQYNRNRYYDYYTGRWLSHDPLGIVPNQVLLNPFEPTDQYLLGLNIYEYVLSNPQYWLDTFGLEACPGGKWWIAGAADSSSYLAISIAKLHLRWECQKRQLIGKNKYCCSNVEFEQKVYYQPFALGAATAVDIGPGLGVSHMWIVGEVSGKYDSSDLARLSGQGPSANITIIVIGAGIGGGGDDNYQAAGLQPGLGVSLNIFGFTKTWLYGDGVKRVEEKLEPPYGQLIKQDCEKKEYESISNGGWEDVPKTEQPFPEGWFGLK